MATTEHPAPRPAPRTGRLGRAGDAVLVLAGLLPILLLAAVPLGARAQAAFAVATVLAFAVASRFRGPLASLLLVCLSLAMTLRYLVWRIADTLDVPGFAAQALAIGLVAAEIYAAITLALGYFQTIQPLNRAPVPLPADPEDWPTVDVFIPTLDESLTVVRLTVLAALQMDWPRDKLRVHLLDDGQRGEFRAFAAQTGCNYLSRPDTAGAKAGNLNAALAQSTGEFVAVFDCDQVPTRAFLQLTLGWLVARPDVAFVQTPQHHYAPDSFQRNVAAARDAPPDGAVFHGLIQRGRDFWGAAAFTGTGAVLRRQALAETGGFARETVTEDAHTALRLHKQGWHSVFLPLPLAAGLPPERLAGHIAQRRRWARGLTQLLRRDPPLLARGLTVAQRLCHMQAALHFLFALPRLAFLTAPLAYLLAGQSVIAASPLAISAYALPHLALAAATASRLQGRWRHTVWSGVYETVLALHLIGPVLAALIRPRRGGFTVTRKDLPAAPGFFDSASVWPNVLLAGALTAGLLRAAVGLSLSPDMLARQALAMNAVWAAFSLAIVLASLAVGRESPQASAEAAIPATLPARIRGGAVMVPARTRTLSRTGATLTAPPRPEALPDTLRIAIDMGGETLELPARVLRWQADGLQVAWQPGSLADEALIVRVVFGRADAWLGWADHPPDRPWRGVWQVLAAIGGLARGRRGAGAALVLVLSAGAALAQQPAARPAAPAMRPAPTGMTVRVIPQPLPPLPLDLPNIVIGGGHPASPAVQAAPATPVAAAPLPAPAPALAPAGPPPLPPVRVRTVELTLRQMGAGGPQVLRGAEPLRDLRFGVRDDEVVTQATLRLRGALSGAMPPDSPALAISLNGQTLASVASESGGGALARDIPIGPALVRDSNRLTLRFVGHDGAACAGPPDGQMSATIGDGTVLALTLEHLPVRRDLSRLPRPFFDPLQPEAVDLPFVLPGTPGGDALRAAGIAASWFGALSGERGARFAVQATLPVTGNAVLVIAGAEGRDLPGLSSLAGPTLALLPNPLDPFGTLLVIGGRNGEEAAQAAAALAAGSARLAGHLAVVHPPSLAPRQPYDAPAWMPPGRTVRLGELADAAALRVTGLAGTAHVPVRTAPDLYTPDGVLPLDLRWRTPGADGLDRAASHLEAGLDGRYLASAPLLAPGGWFGGGAAAALAVALPVSDIGSRGDLQIHAAARPRSDARCQPLPADLGVTVDPDSTLGLGAAYRFAPMPDLGMFARAGFPFTRMADLSQTAVVLPEPASAAEIAAYLNLMGWFGRQTGLAALGVTVVRPDGVAAVADRDLLLVGLLPRLQAAAGLLSHAGARPGGTGLALAAPGALAWLGGAVGDSTAADRARATAALAPGLTSGGAVLTAGESPLQAGRSVVALLAGGPAALASAIGILQQSGAADGPIQGDLAWLGTGAVASYRIAPGYSVGHLPVWLWLGWALQDRPVVLLPVALAGSWLLALGLHGLLRRRSALGQLHEPITGREPGGPR